MDSTLRLPKISPANQLNEHLLSKAVAELWYLDSSDEEVDDILDALNEDLNIVPLFRYTYRSIVPKNLSWFEQILPDYDDKRFRMFLRCSRPQFEVVLNLIKDHPVFNGVNSQKQFTVYFQLALVMYRLGASGDGATVGKIAGFFGIGDGGTIDKVTKRVFESILALEPQFVTWPTAEERMKIVAEKMDELPYCIGYVDGTEIPLSETPTLDHTSYYSRNKQYSIKLQLVCDYTKRIRQLKVGYPGSIHDARVYNECGLATYPTQFFTHPQWIAGDSAYRLTETVMTPFRSNATYITETRRTVFNKRFSSFRVRIEHTNGILKEKLPSLKNLSIQISDVESHKFACKWIRVCCVIHNILLSHYDDEDLFYDPLIGFSGDDEEPENFDNANIQGAGYLKRLALLEILEDV